MSELRVKISGFGGQGIILSAYIVGKAVTVHDGKYASMTQAYGPESRGGACSSELVIDKKEVSYPLVDSAEHLIAMSQEGYDKFVGIIQKKGTLYYDSDLVKKLKPMSGFKVLSIPATRIAEKLGKKIISNIVMLGFFTANSVGVVSKQAMLKSVKESVPEKFRDLNIKAFEEGYNYKPKTGEKK